MTINDSVTLVSGATSALIATDLVTSGSTAANYQYVKMVWGADGTINPVNTAGTNGPLPAQLYSNGTQITNTSGRLNVDLQGSGVTLGVTGDVTMSGDVGIVAGTTVGVTGDVSVSVVDGTTVGVTGDVTVSGNVGIVAGTTTGVTGDVTVSGDVGIIAGTTVGVTGDVTVSGNVGIVAGTTVGVTGDVSVSATDLDIRGLTFGTPGYSGDALGSFDSVIVQGATGAFPVTAALGFITADGSVDYFGKSGDALKVALTDSAFSATVNVGSVIGVNSQNTLAVSGTSGSNSAFAPITIAGTANSDLAVGITTAAGVSLPVMGTVSVTGTVTTSGTVTATDLDIRGITGGTWGATAGLGSLEDSIVVQGSTGAFPVATALAGFTIDGSPILLQTEVIDATTQALKTVIDGRGITNATAMQIQGRNDGSTLDPVYIAGVGPTSDVSPDEGLIGVTFDQPFPGMRVHSGLTAPGTLGLAGASASAIAVLLHGASGSSILPIGMTNDAINVNMVNADGISFAVNVASDIKISNNATSAEALPVKGSDIGNTGVFVTGTGGTSEPFPIMIRGYTTERGASSGDAPVAITSSQLDDIINGSTGSLELTYRGLTGICAAFDGLKTSVEASTNQTNILAGSINTLATDINTDLDTLVGGNGIMQTIGDTQATSLPSKRVYIEVPTPTNFVQESVSAIAATIVPFTNGTQLRSGARFKLHPGADQVVFIGSGTVGDVGKFYPLSAGEDIFIEIDKISKVSVYAPTTGSNLTVFAIGF